MQDSYWKTLKNATIIDVIEGELREADVLIKGEKIAYVGSNPPLKPGVSIDCTGLYLSPGLLDAHMHPESSMVRLPELSKMSVAHGTTGIFADCREICSVLGIKGLLFMMEEAKSSLVRFFFVAPVIKWDRNLETRGEVFEAKMVPKYLGKLGFAGLGEVVYTYLLKGDPEVTAAVKAALDLGMTIDGHIPTMDESEVKESVRLGLMSCHESSSYDEARVKAKYGLWLMAREGSAARNLSEVIKVSWDGYDKICLCTDDITAERILEVGHMDHLLRLAVEQGLDPVKAVRYATLNTARYFKLESKLGCVEPGRYADLVLFNSLKTFEVETVLVGGRIVFRDGKVAPIEAKGLPSYVVETFRTAEFTPDSFRIRRKGENVRVIIAYDGSIYTDMEFRRTNPSDEYLDASGGLLKVAVIERHRMTGNVGLGFVEGFGELRGAIASSVAHDSHNIVVVGSNDYDMYVAASKIATEKGGLSVARGGSVRAFVGLKVAGLMSECSAEHTAERLKKVLEEARSSGCILREPFSTLSFLTLVSVPRLKITDKGLVDVAKGKIVELQT